MPGRYYEQWTLGDQIRHKPHRTVTETDNLLVSAITPIPAAPSRRDLCRGDRIRRIASTATFTFALLVVSRSATPHWARGRQSPCYDKYACPSRCSRRHFARRDRGDRPSRIRARGRKPASPPRASHVQPARRDGSGDGAYRPDAAPAGMRRARHSSPVRGGGPRREATWWRVDSEGETDPSTVCPWQRSPPRSGRVAQ